MGQYLTLVEKWIMDSLCSKWMGSMIQGILDSLSDIVILQPGPNQTALEEVAVHQKRKSPRSGDFTVSFSNVNQKRCLCFSRAGFVIFLKEQLRST